MEQLEVTPDTAAKMRELGMLWGLTEKEAVAHIVERWHEAYVKGGGSMPQGWTLNEDLTLGDLETYFTYFDKEPTGGGWIERGSTLRAAVKAGWITADKPLTDEDVKALKPAAARAAKNALDALYVRLVTSDPN